MEKWVLILAFIVLLPVAAFVVVGILTALFTALAAVYFFIADLIRGNE